MLRRHNDAAQTVISTNPENILCLHRCSVYRKPNLDPALRYRIKRDIALSAIS
jgi:hypothetical protein